MRISRPALFGLILIILVAVLAPWLAADPVESGRHALIPYSPTAYNLDAILQAPSTSHILGTDDQGRDLAARLIHGTRTSLIVGLVAVSISTIIGLIFGAFAGFRGGKTDLIFSRIIEVVLCFPIFFLVLAIVAYVGSGLTNVVFVIGLTRWTEIARLTRGEVFRLKSLDYVTAARANGVPEHHVLFRHILPNALAPIFATAAFSVGTAILIEASLSFLGFGIQPPTPSWGSILAQAREFSDVAWWLAVFPGLALFLTIWLFLAIGESLRRSQNRK